jgi:hypothetical protein
MSFIHHSPYDEIIIQNDYASSFWIMQQQLLAPGGLLEKDT